MAYRLWRYYLVTGPGNKNSMLGVAFMTSVTVKGYSGVKIAVLKSKSLLLTIIDYL